MSVIPRLTVKSDGHLHTRHAQTHARHDELKASQSASHSHAQYGRDYNDRANLDRLCHDEQSILFNGHHDLHRDGYRGVHRDGCHGVRHSHHILAFL